MDRYNYVIFATNDHFYRVSYADAIKLDHVRYYSTPVRSKFNLSNMFYQIHNSSKINSKLNLPFKNLWKQKHFINNFDDNKPICFIFFSNWLKSLEYRFPDYLKREYPNSKLVLYFQDLIALKKNIEINRLKKTFDLILSFDHKESQQYNLNYYPLSYSSENLVSKESDIKYDVYFLGYAKNRIRTIISAYETLRDNNVSCNFYIAQAKHKDRAYERDIKYIKSMHYNENLRHIRESRCILEVMQAGGHGYTLRMLEAIAYDKRIITNNPEVKRAPFFNPTLISKFDDPTKIDIEFIKNSQKDLSLSYNYKHEISPKKLLDYLEKKLS